MNLPVLSERNSVRVAVLLLAIAQYAVMFDQWWHAAFGRDSFTIPPHFFVYGTSAVLILFSWYAWSVFRKPLWRRLGIVMTVLPLSAPIDNFWHATFGIEPVRSLLVAWSPPHVLLTFMFLITQYLLLRLVRSYESDTEAKKLLTILLLTLFASSVAFLVMPFQAFNHFHVIGLYGFIVTLPVLVSFIIFSRRELGFAGATLFAGFYLSRAFAGGIESFETFAPISPLWVSAAPMLLAALSLDMMPRRTRIITQAVVFAAVFALARVGAFYMFGLGVQEKFRIAIRMDFVVLAFSIIVGVMIGGLIYYVFERWYLRAIMPDVHGA